jgi:esterase/lipase superfamily enzyme
MVFGRSTRHGRCGFGHWGPPTIIFPTSGGDGGSIDRRGRGARRLVERGPQKLYCVDQPGGAFISRRTSFTQLDATQYANYIRRKVVCSFGDCQSADIGITVGASLGAYHAANTLFKFPDVIKRCFALSGVYDMKRFMDGAYDDNFYFNNPVDYLSNLSDSWTLGHLASCDIHIATGTGPWEKSDESAFSRAAASGITSTTGVRWAATTGLIGRTS